MKSLEPKDGNDNQLEDGYWTNVFEWSLAQWFRIERDADDDEMGAHEENETEDDVIENIKPIKELDTELI